MSESKNSDVPFEQRDYQVFNHRRTIGASAAFGGATRGVFLGDAVKSMNERALAQQILAVVAVASMRGRLALREKLEEGDAQVAPATYELLDSVPTVEEFERFKAETLRP